jgi:glycosyltransferase involved in cell wall biosynthesis
MPKASLLKGTKQPKDRTMFVAQPSATKIAFKPKTGIRAGGQRFALIGNALPRKCGIATFTTDLHAAILALDTVDDAVIVAMNDTDAGYAYPASVALTVRENLLPDYKQAADNLNNMNVDAICLQHEFGIFGGPNGRHVLALIERLRSPVITTFHTILANPDPRQKATLSDIADASQRVVVMSVRGRDLLENMYGVPGAKVDVIPHGVPERRPIDARVIKERLGFGGRDVILTFGLLAPNKGIEVMIDAMPGVLATSPSALYVVLGATHPNLVRTQGEAYREQLNRRIRDLEISDSVVLIDRFVEQRELLDFIAICDVYVTPYLNEDQMTSGTLAYSFGLGKAVVSTPYWHARDLLGGGLGRIVPFGDVDAITVAVEDLLVNTEVRETIGRQAYRASRSMVWSAVARRYTTCLKDAIRQNRRLEGVSAVSTLPRLQPTFGQ